MSYREFTDLTACTGNLALPLLETVVWYDFPLTISNIIPFEGDFTGSIRSASNSAPWR